MAKPNKSTEVHEVKINPRPCETCKHYTSGVIFGYPWAECKKNWSDKQNGLFWGVLKNTCNNHIKETHAKEYPNSHKERNPSLHQGELH